MLGTEPQDDLVLPPLFAAREADTPKSVMAEAVALAPNEGAGTLVHAVDGETLAFAVVLEPDRPLVSARLAFFAGMASLADAIAAHCPPERDIRFAWPDEIRYDSARLGGGLLVAPQDCADDAVPDWLVFGAELIWDRPDIDHTGLYPDSISLAEEEFEHPAPLIESFSRHFLRSFDAWANEGAKAVTGPYLERLEPMGEGDWLIDGRGDLLARDTPGRAPRRHGLVDGLSRRRWYDPARKAPKL